MGDKNILIACSHYWPSVGGLETSMGQLAGELVAAGYSVTVITLAFPNRTADMHLGVRIASVPMPEFQLAIRAAVASGAYDGCLLIQDPLGTIIWSIEQLQPPAHTRVLIQPIINEDGYSRWKDNREFRQRLAAILKGAAAALTMTKSGPDHRFMSEAGVAPVYLPNASAKLVPAGDFRQQLGIPADRFLILHVANLYWVKNHIGLIDALADMPPDWHLVMIGNPTGASDCVQAVQAKLASRPDVRFIPGLPPEWIAAAMHAANVVVLASHGEGSPITLLEAMSHRKPWLATPTCGAANDHLGGLVCPLDQFMPRLRQLAALPAVRSEFGELSYKHWQQCYAWPVVLQGWRDLFDTGQLQRSFAPSAELVARQQQLCLALDETAAATPEVSLVVLVEQHAGYLRQTLDSVEQQQFDAPFEIIILTDGADHAAVAECREFAARSRRAVKLLLQPAHGRWHAMQRQCSGQFIAICSGDFWLHPEKLAYQRKALSLLPQVDLAFHKIAAMHAQRDEVAGFLGDHGNEPRLFTLDAVIEADAQLIPPTSVMFRRSLLEKLPDAHLEDPSLASFCLQTLGAAAGGALYLPVCAGGQRPAPANAAPQQPGAADDGALAAGQHWIELLLWLRRRLPATSSASLERLLQQRFLQYCQHCFEQRRLAEITPLAAYIEQERNTPAGNAS